MLHVRAVKSVNAYFYLNLKTFACRVGSGIFKTSNWEFKFHGEFRIFLPELHEFSVQWFAFLNFPIFSKSISIYKKISHHYSRISGEIEIACWLLLATLLPAREPKVIILAA